MFSYRTFSHLLRTHPSLTLIWGDFGTGKTTLALQLIKDVLEEGMKIFYLYTKRTPLLPLIKRVFSYENASSLEAFLQQGNFHLHYVDSFLFQFYTIFSYHYLIQKYKSAFSSVPFGLIVVDEIASLYLFETNPDSRDSKANERLILQLATLKKIAMTFNVPILLLDSFHTKHESKKEEDEEKHTEENTGSEKGKDHKKIVKIKKRSSDRKNVQVFYKPSIVPYGGKLLEYWIDNEFGILRVPKEDTYRFVKVYALSSLEPIPREWIWSLKKEGFS